MSKHLIALTMLVMLPTAHAGELGRLFNTPEQRLQLEVHGSRSSNSSNNKSENRNYIAVDGVVQRHGGNRIVWINGSPQAAGHSNDRTPASVPVTVPGKANPVQLKVGQKLLLNTPPPAEPDESKPAGPANEAGE